MQSTEHYFFFSNSFRHIYILSFHTSALLEALFAFEKYLKTKYHFICEVGLSHYIPCGGKPHNAWILLMLSATNYLTNNKMNFCKPAVNLFPAIHINVCQVLQAVNREEISFSLWGTAIAHSSYRNNYSRMQTIIIFFHMKRDIARPLIVGLIGSKPGL